MDTNENTVLEPPNEKSTFNTCSRAETLDMEACFREITTELQIKTTELKQLKTELYEANLKNHELEKALNVTQKNNQEYEFNINIFMKKLKSCEDQLQEKRNALMKIQLQQKMADTEVEYLKTELQNTSILNADLSRKSESLEAKLKMKTLYLDDLMTEQNKLFNLVNEVQKENAHLRTDQQKVVDAAKELKESEDLLHQCKFLKQQIEYVNKEKDRFEDTFVKLNAKYEKLQELLNKRPDINQPNLIMKLVFEEWHLKNKHDEMQLTDMNNNLTRLSESLGNETKAKIKLIYETEALEKSNMELVKENTELKEKLKKSLESHINIIKSDEDIIIKDEPIEIIDN